MDQKHIDNSDLVYVFKDVYFLADKIRYCVSSVRLFLEENGIPILTVALDPKHKFDDSPVLATIADLPTMFNWYNLFQTHVKNNLPADFSMQVVRISDEETQTLNLIGWIITSVEMTPSARGGPPILSVTLQHPVYNISKSSADLGNVANDTTLEMATVAGYEDPVDAISQTILEAVKTIKSPVSTIEHLCLPDEMSYDLNALNEKIKTIIEAVAVAIPKYLKWEDDIAAGYSSWPLIGDTGCLKNYKTALILTYCEQFVMLSDTNIWQLFTNISSKWGFSVIPYFWQEQLIVRPCTPWWSSQEAKILDTDITTIKVSPDTEPKAGVQQLVPIASIMDYSNFTNPELVRAAPIQWAGYIPQAFFAEKSTLNGSLDTFNVPQWLANIPSIAASSDGKKETAKQAESGTMGNPTKKDLPAGDNPDFAAALDLVLNSAFIYAFYIFLSIFRRNQSIALETRLLIQHANGSYFIPGFVYGIMGKQSNNTLLEFYCTSVEHVIDCQNQEARTSIAGYHVRADPEGGSLKGVIAIPQKNPLYA